MKPTYMGVFRGGPLGARPHPLDCQNSVKRGGELKCYIQTYRQTYRQT